MSAEAESNEGDEEVANTTTTTPPPMVVYRFRLRDFAVGEEGDVVETDKGNSHGPVSVRVCLSVCLSVSVTSRCSIETERNKGNTIRDAILTCARKPTRVSLIYRTKPTSKKCKNRKTKSRKQMCSEITVNRPGNPCSEYLRRRKEGLQWEGFTEKEGFKPGMKE